MCDKDIDQSDIIRIQVTASVLFGQQKYILFPLTPLLERCNEMASFPKRTPISSQGKGVYFRGAGGYQKYEVLVGWGKNMMIYSKKRKYKGEEV